MSSEQLGSAVNVLNGNLGSAWNIFIGKSGENSFPPPPSVLTLATNAYALYDLYGTGGAVVRFLNSASTPTERDFTATELTDGTYTSWYVSGTTAVTTIYDQKASLNLVQSSGATQPDYIASDNVIDFERFAFFGEQMASANDQSVIDNYEGNGGASGHNGDVTLIQSLIGNSSNTGTTTDNFFGIREGFAPVGFEQAAHRCLSVKDTTTAAGHPSISAKSDTTAAVTDISSVAFSTSTMKTYTGTFQRVEGGVVTTNLKLYENDTATPIVDANNTTMTSTLSQDKFQVGGRPSFQTSAMLAFNIVLTAEQIAAAHTELSANY
jgi:hypothetical protein